VSQHLRDNPPTNCDSKGTCDDFIRQVNSEMSVVTFLKGLFSRYHEGFESHILRDGSDNIYTLDPKEKLVNDDGELKERVDDLTNYGGLLKLVQDDLGDIRDNYSEYIRSHPGTTTTVNGTTYGTQGPVPTGTVTSPAGSTMDASGTPSTPDGVSSTPGGISSTPDGVSSYGSSTKCIADNGTPIGGVLCCGQEGTLQDTRFICPNDKPTCSGYKCGSNFGTCS
jgi:hypothetical protein